MDASDTTRLICSTEADTSSVAAAEFTASFAVCLTISSTSVILAVISWTAAACSSAAPAKNKIDAVLSLSLETGVFEHV